MKPFRVWGTLAFLSLVWGTTWIAIKYSLEGIPPFLGATLRFSLALIILAALALWRRTDLRLPPRAFTPVVSSAILLYLLDYGLIYWGEQYLNAGVTAVFFATFPLFTALSSNLIFREERFDRNKIIGVLLGFAGTLVVFIEQVQATRFDARISLASLAIILSALAAALSLVITKKFLSEVNTLSLTLHQMLWGTLSLAVTGFFLGEFRAFELTLKVGAAVFYLGAFGSALAFVLYYQLLKKMSSISLSYIIYITPLVALGAGYLLLGETLTWQTLLGTGIIFTGVFFSGGKRARKV